MAPRRGEPRYPGVMSDARVENEPSPPTIRSIERVGFLAAETEPDDAEPLTAPDVREALERLRADRS